MSKRNEAVGGVQLMREIRDRMNAEIADMSQSHEELSQRVHKGGSLRPPLRTDPQGPQACAAAD